MRNRAAWAAFIILACSAGAASQQPTFKSDTGAVVSIFATVIDRTNRLVPDLIRDDFEVLDNDRPQPLTLFENEARPISVVLMLDTSASMTGNLKLLQDAAEQFLIRLMPGDKAKVGAFNDKIELSGHFTNDRDELVSELRQLDYGNATRLFDAAALSIDELAPLEGRRVLVILSDGEDTSSRIGFGAVMDRARSDDIMIYAIGLASDFFDGTRMVRSRPDGGLRRLADETGGGYFELKKTSDLAPTFTRVAQELHSQYVLGFVAQRLDNRVHKLTVRLKQPGMTARARRSYLASADDGSSGK
jgi:Ca-activated chloride channel family protein